MSDLHFPGYKKIEFDKFPDSKGILSVLDSQKLPFIPKRLFILETADTSLTRGNHGHLKCKQLLFCIGDEVEVNIVNAFGDFVEKISEPWAIYLPEGNWCSIKFKSSMSAVVVLANQDFNQDDYFYDKPIHSQRFSK